jgi:hypothetical protein
VRFFWEKQINWTCEKRRKQLFVDGNVIFEVILRIYALNVGLRVELQGFNFNG